MLPKCGATVVCRAGLRERKKESDREGAGRVKSKREKAVETASLLEWMDC